MVVARNLISQHRLVEQMQARSVTRRYEAIVYGIVSKPGLVDLPIGRHPVNRKKMAVRENGKKAITHYQILHSFPEHTHLAIRLETGRTHQIRVHMAHQRHPLVGDAVYGGKFRIPVKGSMELKDALSNFNRQALHARELALVHPSSGNRLRWRVDLPGDMTGLLDRLMDSENLTAKT